MKRHSNTTADALSGQTIRAALAHRKLSLWVALPLLFACFMPATVCAQAVVNDTTRAHNIKEVVVKANRGARAVGMIKQTAEQLKVEMPADMTDLVRYMPSVGVSISGSRGGMRGFAMRGVEANRVAISVDGILQPLSGLIGRDTKGCKLVRIWQRSTGRNGELQHQKRTRPDNERPMGRVRPRRL